MALASRESGYYNDQQPTLLQRKTRKEGTPMNDYYVDVDNVASEQKKEKRSKNSDYMNLGLFTFLVVITLGIYGIYWQYKFTEKSNDLPPFPQRRPWVQLLLCIFVPYYRCYWVYMTALRFDTRLFQLGQTGGKMPYTSAWALGLSIFGLDVVSWILLRNQLNQLAGGATGESPKSTGYGHCKNCDRTFPDDYQTCPTCGTPYKKPFYRQLWFSITCAVIALLAIYLTTGTLLSNQVDKYSFEEEYSEPATQSISVTMEDGAYLFSL